MASTSNHFLTLLFSAMCFISCSSGQYFSVQPQDTEVVVGSKVTMTCRVFNRPEGSLVYWITPAATNDFIGPDYDVPSRYINKYEIIGDPRINDYNLVINDVTAEDDGDYICLLFQPGRGDLNVAPTQIAQTREASLTVATLSPTGAPACWASPRRTVHVGSDITIYCASIFTNNSLTWNQDSSSLTSSSNSTATIPTLIMTTFTAEASMNEARFTCASESDRNRQCQIVLDVTFPPEVTIEPVGEIRAGHEGRFRCSATGNPNVFVYFWKYNEEVIEYRYHRRFNRAILEESNTILALPDMDEDDDAALLECTAVNEHGQGVSTFPIRVASNNTTSVIAWSLCAIIVAIILVLLISFCFWRSRQHRKLEKLSEIRRSTRPRSGPIETEMNGNVNPAFTGFSHLEIDSVGYGPDVQPYQSRPSERDYDTGEPKPIPARQGSKSVDTDSDYIAMDVDEEVTQTYTYQVNPKFEEYRNKASYDVSYDDEIDAVIEDKKPLPQNDLDLEKELVGELSMFSDYDKNFDEDAEPVVVSTEL
ncbi:uncharacterized protein LOC129258907 [Lytechinus pictus]|uniref:uncharacterized protein LOC129258907 n=1 Tax=Lytechinus pictus TaxID=7653 RepID=UPI0030BA020D